MIATLGDTIRWELTHIGDGDYVIRSASDPTKYLSVTASSSAEVNLTTVSGETIPDSCRWKLSNSAHGGVLIRNDISYIDSNGNEQISDHTLYHYNNTLAAGALPSSSNSRYDRYVWRVASTDYYGNTASHSKRELSSNFSIDDIRLGVGETATMTLNNVSDNTIWVGKDDFIVTSASSTSDFLSFNESTWLFTGTNYGGTTYTVVHNVTGLTMVFDASIVPLQDGVYYIQNLRYHMYMQVSADNAPSAIEQVPFDGKDHQQWFLSLVGEGYYKIVSTENDYAVTVPYTSSDGVDLILQYYSGLSRQRWRIVPTSNGGYTLQVELEEENTTEMLVMSVEDTSGDGNGLAIEQLESNVNGNEDEWRLGRIVMQSSVEVEGQEESQWCWAAVARMFVKHQFPALNLTQEDAVIAVKGYAVDEAANIDEAKEAIAYFMGGGADVVSLENHIYSEATLLRFLNDNHVMYISRGRYYNRSPSNDNPDYYRDGGHAWLIGGYVDFDGDMRYLLYNPEPVGVGSYNLYSYEKLVNGMNAHVYEPEMMAEEDNEIYHYAWDGCIAVPTEYSRVYISKQIYPMGE